MKTILLFANANSEREFYPHGLFTALMLQSYSAFFKNASLSQYFF